MPKRLALCLLLISSIFSTLLGFAQDARHAKLNERISDSLVSMYRNAAGQANRFYNGTEYMGYVMRPKGHPFFNSDRMQYSEISYEGVVYSDSILYDLIDDAIVIRNYDGTYNLKMVDEKVRSFTFKDHLFLRLGASTDSTDEMPPGFYDLVYNGDTKLLVRHRKQLNTTSFQSEIISEYVQYDSYFIKKQNEYYRITSTKNLIEALREKKGEVRKFLREHKLDIKSDPLNTTRKAVEYFDQLNK